MKYGYNERIQKKIADLDGAWDEWYWLMRVLSVQYKQTPTSVVYARAIRVMKLNAHRNPYIKRNRLHNLKKSLLEWETNVL